MQTAQILESLLIRPHTIPHLILYGPPGSGKTKAIQEWLKELYKGEQQSNAFVFDFTYENGIRYMRDKIKSFARVRTSGSNVNIPSYKIIVLEHADFMTEDAQSALRRSIEIYASITRFVILCNRLENIIDPIRSRCLTVFFPPPPPTVQYSWQLNKTKPTEEILARVQELLTAHQTSTAGTTISVNIWELLKRGQQAGLTCDDFKTIFVACLDTFDAHMCAHRPQEWNRFVLNMYRKIESCHTCGISNSHNNAGLSMMTIYLKIFGDLFAFLQGFKNVCV